MKCRHLLVVVVLLAIGPCSAENQTIVITPETFDFGDHDIGSTTETTFKINNLSKSKLTIWVAEMKGDYSERNDCEGHLEVDGSCTVTLSFSPIGLEERKGSLQIGYSSNPDGKDGKIGATLSGRGFVPDLSNSPADIHFAPQRVKTTSSAQVLTLTNTDTSGVGKEIAISMITADGEFVLESESCSRPLKPGSSCTVIVAFNPQRSGLSEGTLRITNSSRQSPRNVLLSGRGIGWSNTWLCFAQSRELRTVTLVAFMYWLGMVLVRWNRVAQPTRQLLHAEIASLQAQLGSLVVQQPNNAPAQIGSLFTGATDLLAKQKWYSRVANFLFWSRGHELTGWVYLHEAETQMAKLLPPETVRARLETAQQELTAANTSTCLALADKIKEVLTSNPPASLERCRALLAEGLCANYDRVDSNFADLVSWQNKTAWLVSCGLLLIVALSGALDHSVFFLMGGTGGLLSRLSRSLERKDVPTDYGASWTTLFLSPVAGALGGWTGILLTTLAIKVGVLGSFFSVDWSELRSSMTLGVALLFGISERAFDSILAKLENKVADQNASSQQAQKPDLTIATAETLPDGSVGQDYRVELKTSGGIGQVAWTRTDGSLPDGLMLDATGIISGKPTTPAAEKSFTFTGEVKDSVSKKNRQFTIKIN